jgi:hypothetical protein
MMQAVVVSLSSNPGIGIRRDRIPRFHRHRPSPKGAWVSEKHGERKEWMKLHASVDVLTMKIVSVMITDKRVNDSLMAKDIPSTHDFW